MFLEDLSVFPCFLFATFETFMKHRIWYAFFEDLTILYRFYYDPSIFEQFELFHSNKIIFFCNTFHNNDYVPLDLIGMFPFMSLLVND